MNSVLLIVALAGGTSILLKFFMFLVDTFEDFGLFVSLCVLIGLLMLAKNILNV